MNTRCFRLIFSKPLGFLIPVAEITRAQRKPGQQQTASPPALPRINPAFKPLVLSLLLAGLPGWAVAEIVLDPSQRLGTNIISAANGVPVIEIANPTGNGISHNRFTEFDVRQPGIIYNNSLVNGVSELGGAVLRNPNLSRAARAILTEVTGNKPSSISGTLEVFGAKADLLFAKSSVSQLFSSKVGPDINTSGKQLVSSNLEPEMMKKKQAVETITDWYRRQTAKNALDEMGRNAERLKLENFSAVVEEHGRKVAKNVFPLSAEEQVFFSTVLSKEFYVTHATRTVPENKKGDLILHSTRHLQEFGYKFIVGSSERDRSLMGNADYVFFALEVGKTPKKLESRFGPRFYRASYDNPVFTHSSMMLFDPLAGAPQSAKKLAELTMPSRAVLGELRHTYPEMITQGRTKSKETLAYELINVSRLLDYEDRDYVLSRRTDEQINNLINGIFRPQIMVPKRAMLKKDSYTVHITPSS